MKFKRILAVVLSVVCLSGLFLFGGCRTEAERVEANSFVDGYFKYYYIKQTDSYAIVGDGDIPYPETLAIPAYYKGKEITDVYYQVQTGIIAGNKYLGPSLLGVETVWVPYTFIKQSQFFKFVDEYYNLSGYEDVQLGSPQKYFIICNAHITRLSTIPHGGNYPKLLYYTTKIRKRARFSCSFS